MPSAFTWQYLQLSVSGLKSVLFGSSQHILESVGSATATTTNVESGTGTSNDPSMLASFLAQVALEQDQTQREKLQILWQGIKNADVSFLPECSSNCADLVRGIRTLVFDIICLPIDDCSTDMSSAISKVCLFSCKP